MITLHVPDMSCAHCTASVERALLSEAPGVTVSVNLAQRVVRIDGSDDPGRMIAALSLAGFDAVAAG